LPLVFARFPVQVPCTFSLPPQGPLASPHPTRNEHRSRFGRYPERLLLSFFSTCVPRFRLSIRTPPLCMTRCYNPVRLSLLALPSLPRPFPAPFPIAVTFFSNLLFCLYLGFHFCLRLPGVLYTLITLLCSDRTLYNPMYSLPFSISMNGPPPTLVPVIRSTIFPDDKGSAYRA